MRLVVGPALTVVAIHPAAALLLRAALGSLFSGTASLVGSFNSAVGHVPPQNAWRLLVGQTTLE